MKLGLISSVLVGSLSLGCAVGGSGSFGGEGTAIDDAKRGGNGEEDPSTSSSLPPSTSNPPPSSGPGPGPGPTTTPPPPPPPVLSTDPFDPAACTGATITKPQAIAKIGAGNTFKTIAGPTKLRSRKRSCDPVTGCSAWGAPADASHLFYMASGGDNYNVQRPYDVHLRFMVQGTDIHAVVADTSYEGKCAGCTPAGVQTNLATGAIVDFNGNANLFIYYPRWNHTASGFVIMQEWASVPLGPKANTTFTVTDTCARMSVVAQNQETEYAVLYHY